VTTTHRSPRALSSHSGLRTTTLCALYLAQGIPYGFVLVTLVAHLASQGMETAEVAEIMAFTTLPWVLKFLWGPVIDRFTWPSLGRRRPWIIFSEAMMALTLLAMIFLDDLTASVHVLAWMVFLHNCFNALQDVAVDALAVDLLTDDERGKVNGYMWAAKWVGLGIGGAGTGMVLASMGLRGTLVLQVIVLLLIMLFPLLIRERPNERLFPWSKGDATVPSPNAVTRGTAKLLADLARAFSLRSTRIGALLMVLVQTAVGIAGVVAPGLFVQELGWTTEEYSAVAGGYGVVLAIGGALLGGFLLAHFGRMKIMAVAIGLSSLVLVGFGLLSEQWDNRTIGTVYLVALPTCTSLLQVVIFAVCMDISWPRVAASQFTAYMAMLNLSTVMGNWLAPGLTDAFSNDTIFILIGSANLVLILLLPLIDLGQTRRVLGGEEEPMGTTSAQSIEESAIAP
jgi:PAT family beta-lactamase induction signal transducer AmpG